MLKAVFFDLDGTLLTLHEHEFIKYYFETLYSVLKDKGYEDKNKLFSSIMEGTKAMYLNDGKRTNREVFYDVFKKYYGDKCVEDEPIFIEFYKNEFRLSKNACKDNSYARKIIDFLHENNIDAFLTTNPIFPKEGTLTRMSFIDLKQSDFKLITTYEDCCYCKPNPMYFKTILDKFNLKSDEVILFGNNDYEDGECALKNNIKTYLIKGPYLIHNKNSTHQFDQIEMSEVISIIKSEIIKRSGK